FQRRFRGAPDGSGFIKGRTAYCGYFSAFVFFLPNLCAPLPSSLLAPCSSAQIVPHLHSEMASLVRPRHFQTEEEMNTVHRLLGWSPQETAWGIRAGSVLLGDLHAGEFVMFISHISSGLGLPISSFYLLLLEDFGLQLQHLTPHSILLAAILMHLCEMFMGVRPCIILFRHFFILVKSGKGKDEVGAYYFQTRSDLRTPYIPGLTGGKWEDWRKEWVIATTEANERLV